MKCQLRSILVSIVAMIVTNELEHEWAMQGKCSTIGDALHLPFRSETFDAIATSPTYGNRMADHHNAKDASHRISYKFSLGRPLHPSNSGQLQWGESYRQFHVAAWRECDRVLKQGGVFLLNISDHIRNGAVVPVSNWHLKTLVDMGYIFEKAHAIKTLRLRRGANYEKRVDNEYLFVLQKPIRKA